MAIRKDKKRLTVSLHERAVACMDDIISLQDNKFQTYSQIVDIAVVYFYLAVNGYTDKERNSKNENN